MPHAAPAQRWLPALLLLAVFIAPPAHALSWCYPRAVNDTQPCPTTDQCCAIWGICGTGAHFCKPGHCAAGACEAGISPASTPLPPPRPPLSSPPPPSRPPPSPAVIVLPAGSPPMAALRPPSPQPPPASPPSRPGQYVFVPLTDDQKRRMYQLTSIFENADTTLQYGYAERLGDGRGITYGFCGFTTGWSDGLMVVDEYSKLKPKNPLAQYLPALRSNKDRGDRFSGLSGFEKTVESLSKDADFIKAQWTVCDEEYHQPAMRWCQKVGCKLALSKAQFHDALVNHGEGLGDKGSVDWIFIAANKAMGGTPLTGVDEVAYLRAFLAARRKMLEADRTWKDSVTRVDIYRKLVDIGNLNLDGPIYLDLKKRITTQAGQPVWQVLDVYYGEFIVYENPQPDRKLALII